MFNHPDFLNQIKAMNQLNAVYLINSKCQGENFEVKILLFITSRVAVGLCIIFRDPLESS